MAASAPASARETRSSKPKLVAFAAQVVPTTTAAATNANAARRSLRIPAATLAAQQQLRKDDDRARFGNKAANATASAKGAAHQKKKNATKSAAGKSTGRRGQVRAQDRRKSKPLFLTDDDGDKVWIATATLQDLRDRARLYGPSSKKRKKQGIHARRELVTVPSKAVREAVYERAAACWGRHEARMLPKYGGRPWRVTVKISDPKPQGGSRRGGAATTTGGKAAAASAVTPYFAWNDRGSDLLIAAWPHLLDKIPTPPRFPGYSTAAAAAARTRRKARSNQKKKKPVSPSTEPAEADGSDANEDEDGEEDECDEEESVVDDEEEEEESDDDDDEMLEAEITSLSTLAYEERWRVPLPSVSIKWVSPLNKTFATRTSAWDNAVLLCKQEVTIDKVLHGYSANGAPLKPAKPSAKAALTAGRHRFERDGLWVVGQEEAWQLPRLQQQPTQTAEGRSGEPNNGTAERGMSPLAYYLHCNRKEHQAKRQAELKAQRAESASAIATAAAADAGTEASAIPVVTSFTLRDAERELRGMWQQLSDAERDEWNAKCKAHRSAAFEPPKKTLPFLESAILEVTIDESFLASRAAGGGVTSKAMNVVPSTPTKAAGSCPRAIAVTPDHLESAKPAATIHDVGTRASAEPSRAIFPESTRWKMTPEQCQLCHDAGMNHFDRIMRTVQARDLLRELQDGFDLLRERGRGRFDMELPDFDTPAFSFLSDLKKAPWMPIVREILGKDVVLIHKGMFLALPGAERQVYHQDGVHLTTQYQRDVHAINVFVPVVDMSAELGPTEFCLGSHLLGNEDFNEKFLKSPIVKAGTPIIFDYRLGHRGLANASDGCRPIVYCTYARASDGKEFRDTVNFSRKRYHKIGELVGKVATREERARKREQGCFERSDEDPPTEKRRRLVAS